MSDRRSSDAAPFADAADRDSRAEALLVEGLDKYFCGLYEEAIHVWTRVLFLDRSHARARAYIDRARTALGERQRRADEILHAAETSVANGDLDQARALVTQASSTTGDDERVARVWTDIERVARTRRPRGETSVAVNSGAVRPRVSVWGGTAATVLAAGAIGGLLVTLVSSPVVRGWFGGATGTGASASPTRAMSPRVLPREEIALLRARTLYARGRLAEALRALDRVVVPTGDGTLNALRVEIQSMLLSTRPSSIESAMPRLDPGPP